MENHNYITIQGWMVNELKLSGNELLCYALLFGFCQDNESAFDGSLSYIATSLNISKQSVQNVLKKLCAKGYIEKYSEIKNNVIFNRYTCNLHTMQKNCTPYKKFVHHTKNLHGGIQKICMGGIQKICTNNTNIDNNIDIVDDTRAREEEKIKEWKKRKEDYNEFLNKFFAPEKQVSLETLCMSLQVTPEKLRETAESVVNEWGISEKAHKDYNDMAEHLINTMRIKIREEQKKEKTEKKQQEFDPRRGVRIMAGDKRDYGTEFIVEEPEPVPEEMNHF